MKAAIIDKTTNEVIDLIVASVANGDVWLDTNSYMVDVPDDVVVDCGWVYNGGQFEKGPSVIQKEDQDFADWLAQQWVES